MIRVEKTIETHNGIFKMGKLLDESENPTEFYIIHFYPKGKKGVMVGKKKFESLEDVETYVHLLNVRGFSRVDL